MPRLPRVSAREVRRAIERDGWQIVRTSGSHMHFAHATKPGIVTVAMHTGTIPPGTLRGIINQAGLTIVQFIDLL